MACAFTHSRPDRTAPYFSSNQRTKRMVLNPDESGANDRFDRVQRQRTGRDERLEDRRQKRVFEERH